MDFLQKTSRVLIIPIVWLYNPWDCRWPTQIQTWTVSRHSTPILTLLHLTLLWETLLCSSLWANAQIVTQRIMVFNSYPRHEKALSKPRPDWDAWTTLETTKVRVVYWLGSGKVVYEGYGHLLPDGSPYKLGKSARQDGLQGYKLNAWDNSKNQNGHVCVPLDKRLLGSLFSLMTFIWKFMKVLQLTYLGLTTNNGGMSLTLLDVL